MTFNLPHRMAYCNFISFDCHCEK